MNKPEPQNPTGQQSSRAWRIFKRMLVALLLFIGGYVVLLLIGLVPVNNDFEPTADGVTIYLVSNPIHSDIVMPMEHEVINWREQFPAEYFAGQTDLATRVAVGWGDQGFYINTPRWSDFRISTAVHAVFWPSKTCMHVTCMDDRSLPADAEPVTISAAQYAKLVEYIQSSFQRDESGAIEQIEGAAYHDYDAFFEARGAYHGFNTCNCWTGRALKNTGVRVGWFTPMPKTPLLYLPDSETSSMIER